MQTNAIVPNKPLKTSNGLFIPQGFIFLLLIIKEVINKLISDLKNTSSYIGILLSIFFTQTVIRLKKIDANIKFTFLKGSFLGLKISICITKNIFFVKLSRFF